MMDVIRDACGVVLEIQYAQKLSRYTGQMKNTNNKQPSLSLCHDQEVNLKPAFCKHRNNNNNKKIPKSERRKEKRDKSKMHFGHETNSPDFTVLHL